ncbi:MAG: NfeD family protein [Spirochaetia bacterium]|nr:NfeD family protein [Spirochaetia bacterium]
MSPEELRIAQWIWLVAGIAMVVVEHFVPGIIIVFFGIGGILTALLIALGALPTIGGQLLFWSLSSLVLLLLLRRQIRKWFPSLEDYNPYDEQSDLAGRIVDVVEDIEPGTDNGRVRLHGTTWKASAASLIRSGEKVRVVKRDNLILEVEPLEKSS